MLEPDAVVADRYVVHERLGAGGMGEVFLGHDRKLDRPVALKVLKAWDSGDDTARSRLLREARAAARLEHPGIVQVFDVGETDEGDAFLVMELIRGRSVRELIREGPLPLDEALRIVAEVAAALWSAHAQGVVHRDVKPDNAMVREDGRVVLVDFGLVKRLASPLSETATPDTPTLQGLTRSGTMVGTPAYLAPEQARGQSVAATDQWALAVMAYELLAGRLPWDGQDTTHILAQIMVDQPPPLSSLAGGIPPSADAALARALEKDPRARHEDVCTFASALLESFGLEMLSAASGTRRSRPTPSSRPIEIPNNLPPMPSTFVGRRAELDALTRRFEDGARLVTVTGTGGTGKTRFTCHYASQRLDEYPGGVWFCDLADAATVTDIVNVVGAALGIALGDEPVELLGKAIRESGDVLILLDNFEQIVEHAAVTVARWTGVAPRARFLVTSREPLHVMGEQPFPLDALPMPSLDSLEEMRANEGVQLFVERAREVAPRIELTDTSLTQIAEVVRLVDGLPLAIELAAARTRVLSAAKLVERLSKRFALLRTSRRDRSSRHSTLRAAIDWSWDLCTDAEQLALAQCSVFRGGFDLEAGEAVIDASSLPKAPFAIDLVDTLVDKSLLRSALTEDEELRFSMYVSIQEYAADKLREAGPEVQLAAERRHGEHYSALGTDEALEAVHGRDDVALRRTLATEQKNVAVALARALAERDADRVDPLTHAHSLAIGMMSSDAIRWLERSLESVHIAPGRRARLLSRLARTVAAHRPGCSRARELFADAIALAEESEQRGLAARVRIDSCHWAAIDRDRERGLETLREAGRVVEELGDDRYVARAAQHAGAALISLGRNTEARSAYERGLEQARRLGARTTISSCLNGLAIINQLEGRNEEAFDQLREFIVLHREVRDRSSEGHGLAVLADYLQQAGRLAEAEEHVDDALRTLRPTGNVRAVGIAEYALAMTQLQQGAYDDAQTSIQASVRSLETAEDAFELSIAVSFQARILHARGDLAAARAALTRARALIAEANVEPGSEPRVREAQAAAIIEGRAGEGGNDPRT